MKHTLTTGISFGLTSAIITTLGLIIGLYSANTSRLVIIAGILTIAISDAFSDALGIHISEESESKHSQKEIWEATFFTFLAKFIFALTFLVPILIFKLSLAIVVNIFYGILLLSFFSFYLARKQKIKPLVVILEHLGVAFLVIVFANFVGKIINYFIKL